ncbi:MAG: arginine decarboxylase [Bacteroidia bacterium]|nr:arginine decarboxylase [Bacteroidia bacterium]
MSLPVKNKYIDLINQTFYFPRHGFEVRNNQLYFHDVDLMALIKQFGTPLKFTYLPKIGSQINKSRTLFNQAIERYGYKGSYYYCYCTKSSHFSFVLDAVLKEDADIETSSAFDLDLLQRMHQKGKFPKSKYIICNGYKTDAYARNMNQMVADGFENLFCVLDNPEELDVIKRHASQPIKLGIRIATEEEPGFLVYTSRLGMSSKTVKDFYLQQIQNNPLFKLKMVHFFVNSGIKDTTYYWSELTRLVNVYCDLKEVCPDLDTLDIGGGMPIYTSLGVEHDYPYMIDQIVYYIKTICDSRGVPEPNIFTEFGSFTVGESGGSLYSIIGQKQQNDKEFWYMIDSSFITTLPDTWGIGQKFILLAINQWDKEFQRINLGGLTCDSQDFYNSDTHTNQVFMPKLQDTEPLYMGFFHTGAYQESLGGYGGIQHCLVPAPKHIVIDQNADGSFDYQVFAEEQNAESMMKILGY